MGLAVLSVYPGREYLKRFGAMLLRRENE